MKSLKQRLLIRLLKTFAALPYHRQYSLAFRIGSWIYKLNGERVQIARKNIQVCFPDIPVAEQEQLVENNLKQSLLGYLELATSAFSGYDTLRDKVTIEGLQQLRTAQDNGHPVIVLTFHQTTLELGTFLLGKAVPLAGMYRPSESQIIEKLFSSTRKSYFEKLIPRTDIRDAVKTLQQGIPLVYLADQNISQNKCEFVEFFGTKASFTTATSRLVKLTGAKVIPFTQQRLADGKGIELTLHQPLAIQGDDPIADQVEIHTFLENYLRKAPDNYLWLHRRFATRPPGELPIYPLRLKKWKQASPTAWKKLTAKREALDNDVKHPRIWKLSAYSLRIGFNSTEAAEHDQQQLANLLESDPWCATPKQLYLSPNGKRYLLCTLNFAATWNIDDEQQNIIATTDVGNWYLPMP